MKKYINKLLLLIGILFFQHIGWSQNISSDDKIQIDSLNLVIKNNSSDVASIVSAYVELSNIYYTYNVDTVIPLCEIAQNIAQRALLDNNTHLQTEKLKISLAGALNNIGFVSNNKGDVANGLKYYHSSLKLQEEVNGSVGAASTINNIAGIYKNQGDKTNALDYYNRSLKIQEELGDNQGISRGLNNIGGIYYILGNYSKALEYYNRSLKIREETGDNKGIASSLNNIGVAYRDHGDPLIDDYEESKRNGETLALTYFRRSLKIIEETGDKLGTGFSLVNIASLELELGDFESSKNKSIVALSIGKSIGSPILISKSASLLSRIATKNKDFKEALEMYELQIQMQDSLKNKETQKATIRQQTKYEFEKEQLLKEQKLKEESRKLQEETERRDNLQYSFILIGILAVFGLVLSLGKINVSPKFAEGLIFFAFLIFFEFMLVLSDPYVDGLTNGEPMYKLLLNAILAGAIFPLHAFFESTLKKRLIRNNS